jgi:adenylate cyclase
MRRSCFVILLLVCSMSSFGQDAVVDSLNKILRSTIPDTSRVSVLLQLSGQHSRTDPVKAREFALEAKEIAERTGHKSGLAYAHKAIGMTYYFQNIWVDALVQWRHALEIFTSINDLNGRSNMLNNLGAVHFSGGDDKAALDYYLESLRVAEANKDPRRTVTALVNIGTVYLSKESSRPMAYTYYKRALPLSRALGDMDAIGTCAVNLGELFLDERTAIDTIKLYDPDSALHYFELALEAYRSSATGNVPYALKSIGRVYAIRGDYVTAIKHQTEAYQLAMAMEAKLEMAQSLLSLAETHQKKGDIHEAITTFDRAKLLALELDAIYEIEQSYKGLAGSYSKAADYEKAYMYLNLRSDIKDTLYNAEMDKKLQAQTLHYEIEKKEGQISLLEKDQELRDLELKRQKAIRNGTIAFGVLLMVLAGGLFNRYQYTRRTNAIITREKERSEQLLLNILPHEVAEELKAKGEADAVQIDQVSVLFTDFKGFTAMSEQVTPKQLVKDLHECFSAFDHICEEHGLEKIKTIGDAYMAAGGLPLTNTTHATDAVRAALKMRDFIAEGKARKIAAGQPFFEIRIGIHTGPVVAGIVGVKKFSYDIWGETVNTASRMESSGSVGQVNISETTYDRVRNEPGFFFTSRGKVQAKGKGELAMYFVDKEPVEEGVALS